MTLRILTYGAGAVGLGLDSFLLASGASVDIVARPRTVRALRAKGLARAGLFGKSAFPSSRFVCAVRLDDLPGTPYDVVLVTTKSYDSLPAAEDLAAHTGLFTKKTRVILCQNGWGNAEIFRRSFDAKQIFNARIITGFTRPGPSRVKITVHADTMKIGTLFGQPTGPLGPLCAALNDGGFPCVVSDDIGADLWAKLLYNCALNSLGAIFRVPYGALGKHRFSRQLMDEIIREGFAVMTSCGYRTHWPDADGFLKAFYGQMLPATAGHKSSTLQDITAGKRTEIDALNGAVTALAKTARIPVPVNRAVYDMVKFIEKHQRAIVHGP